MSRLTLYAFSLLSGMLLLGIPHAALAAQSYDNCTGFIISLPAVINTQGTWCFKQDLNTAITSGSAITVNTNNVTIDCNDFKLGGLAGGLATTAVGIQAIDRLNATVRHCNIRGFELGLNFVGTGGANIGGGHVIEDNRFDGNTYSGMNVGGDGSVVRRNLVSDTGGSTQVAGAVGIITFYSIDVTDNTITGVAARSGGGGLAYGMTTEFNGDGSIVGNRVRGLVKDGAGQTVGIYNDNSSHVILRNNDLVAVPGNDNVGVHCDNTNGHAKENVIVGFIAGLQGCSDDGGNVLSP